MTALDSASAILEDLLALAGGTPADGAVKFRGSDPVLPTRFRMGELGAAAIAAAALQAARLHRRAGGPDQTVEVDVDAAAAAMRSWRYLTQTPPDPWQLGRFPVNFYPTADGRWLLLHKMFDHHYDRELAVLGVSPDEESIAAAIARRDAIELEEAIVEAGGCAAAVRTREEWRSHPQGMAVSDLPLFRLVKTGESEPEPVGAARSALAGVRVVDMTHVLAGPTTARTLAEHGADVIRIGNSARPERGPMPRDTGHGKRSAELDVRRAGDADVLRRLLRGADVFSQGYRPGALDALGFSREQVAELRPGIVTVSISAFGADGPWASRRGYDSIVQAASGASLESGGTGSPRSIPANPLDYVSGYLAAFLVQVALERRAREGGSYHVELSLAQTGRYLDSLARVDAELAAVCDPELPSARLDELLVQRDTPYGRLRYLKPAARLSRTPGGWARPSAPWGHDEARWT